MIWCVCACMLTDTPLSEMEDYRVEVCLMLRQLERLDKDTFTEDDRADAEEVSRQLCHKHTPTHPLLSIGSGQDHYYQISIAFW